MKTEIRSRIIYYYSSSQPSSEKLRGIIEMNSSKSQIEICRTTEELKQQLKQPIPGVCGIVLLAASREELSHLLTVQEWLIDHRIILVLPDDEPATTSLGHKLRPRFITYQDSNYNDVSVVLGRIIKSYEFIAKGILSCN